MGGRRRRARRGRVAKGRGYPLINTNRKDASDDTSSCSPSNGIFVGLMQRLLIAMPSAWLILVVFKVCSIVTAGDAGRAAVGYTAAHDPIAAPARVIEN